MSFSRSGRSDRPVSTPRAAPVSATSAARARSRSSTEGGAAGPLPAACRWALAVLAATASASVCAQGQDTTRATSNLPPVEVRDQTAGQEDLPAAMPGGQTARGARVGLLGNRSLLDTPFNVTSYTAELIANQQARSVADVAANDPSVRMGSARFNINEDLVIRGFSLPAQDLAFGGMFGITPYFRVPVEAAERVEVLKGPSAMLYGMPPSGSVGGTINLVPKRATSEPLTRLTAQYMSDANLGAHVDVGRRFGPAAQFGVRFNGVYRNGDANIEHMRVKEQLGALGLDFIEGRFRASADLMYQEQDIRGVVRQFTLAPAVTALPAAPSGRNNYPGVGYSIMRDTSWAFRGEFDLTDAATLYAGVGGRTGKMNAVAGNPVLSSSAGDYAYSPAWQLFDTQTRSMEGGLRAGATTGPIKHQATLALTRLDQTQSIYFATNFPMTATNIYSPSFTDSIDVSALSPQRNRYATTTLSSVAFADVMSMFDERVQLTLGGRHQWVQAQGFNFATGAPSGAPYDMSATTPVVALVLKPHERVSLYGNYIEGLSQGGTAPISTAISNPGQVLPPYRTRQKEVGVKADWGRITTGLSLFEIIRPSASANNGVYGINGRQRNRGVELTAQGEVVSGVRLLGGATWLQGRLAQTATGLYQGNAAIGQPRYMVNLGGEWDLPGISGLTATGRVIYTGSQYANIANTVQLPSSTRFDLGARYTTKVAGRAVTLRADVENLANRRYWGTSVDGYLFVGRARTVLVSASLDL